MLNRKLGTRIRWREGITTIPLVAVLFLSCVCAQDYNTPTTPDNKPSPEMEACDGIFLSYTFQGREKEYPIVKNVTAQAWSFKSSAAITNTGNQELKSWQIFIGFQNDELLVSAEGAVVVDGDGFPIRVGKNGTTLAGYPQVDLKTAIDTASDLTQMQAQINFKGTVFGGSESSMPMPKSLKLANEGYICPTLTTAGSTMNTCCKKDPNYKEKKITNKYVARRYGDLSFTYDVIKAYDSKYLAQVTIDNNHPLGRLDQWNLTWEWMRNEFINDMKGAFTRKKDASECIYGPQGKYYGSLDFANVMNCQKKPVIADLPPEKENDDKVGRLPNCCKNGTLLPKTMNETKARAIFQLEVFKIPPDLNRTALNPPQNWKIEGRLSPTYKCGPPVRVDPTEFPDSTGISSTTAAIASWQVTCNMTRPKPHENKCCVSYSAFYSDEAVPCSTCACGCQDTSRCDAKASPMLLPPDALLVPFDNRTEKAKAFAKIKKHPIPNKMPCPDNCGMSINWHVDSDFKDGWTARITLFNWENQAFSDWYTAVQLKKAFPGFEKAFSFNGTKIPEADGTIFMQGLPGLNYLVGEVNGTHPDSDPRVPGKQQTVLSFSKKHISDINVPHGDGFPTRIYFNGEECALPTVLPKRNSHGYRSSLGLIPAIMIAVVTFLFLTDRFN